MSKINSKSLSALRQKMRKYIRETFEEELAKFRENPDADEEPEEPEQEEPGSDESDNERKSASKSRESSVPVDKAKFKKGNRKPQHV